MNELKEINFLPYIFFPETYKFRLTIEFGDKDSFVQHVAEYDLTQTDTTEVDKKQFKGLVYKRREYPKNRGDHSRESIPRMDRVTHTPNITPSSYIDIPIAQRKGIRSCTKHQLSNFVSYLSHSYYSFVSKLDTVSILNNVQETLEIPEWREAVSEEMRALEKNSTRRSLNCQW